LGVSCLFLGAEFEKSGVALKLRSHNLVGLAHAAFEHGFAKFAG